MGASLDGSNSYVRTEESLVATDSDTGCAAGAGPPVPGRVRVRRRDHEPGVHRPVRGQRGIRCRRSRRCRGTGTGLLRHARGDDQRGHRRLGRRLRAVRGKHDAPRPTGPAGGNGAFTAFLFTNGLSDDGTRAFFDTRESLMASDTDTSFDIYVADVAGYPRPAGASPMRLSLVPAYSAVHGPGPHAWTAARPSGRATRRSGTSSQATVGTPDALGGAASSWASSAMSWTSERQGFPRTPTSIITASMSDVRCRPAGASCGSANAAGPADYTGEVRAAVGCA